MAAVSLGNSVSGMIIVLGIGLAMGIEPLVSQAIGANDQAAGRRWLWQGLYVSGLSTVPLAILCVAACSMVGAFGIPGGIASRATLYVYARMPGILFNCTFAAFRAYSTSVGRARPVLATVALANLVNIALDWVLVFGNLGAPALG